MNRLTDMRLYDNMVHGDATKTQEQQAAFFVAVSQSHTRLCAKSRSNETMLGLGDWRLLTGNDVATGLCAFTQITGDAKMLLEKIHHGLATFTLTPEDCRLLARACDEQASEMPTIEEMHDSAMLFTFGAAFQAAEAATRAQGERAVRRAAA